MQGKACWAIPASNWNDFLTFLSIYDQTLHGMAEGAFTLDPKTGCYLLPNEGNNEAIWGDALNDFDEDDFVAGDDWTYSFWTASNLPGSLWP